MRRARSKTLVLASALTFLASGLLPQAAVAAGAPSEPAAPRCYVSPKTGVTAVNVRPTAGTQRPPLGSIQAGQRAVASCRATSGGQYRACGGASHWWVSVRWQGKRGYVAHRCIDWYRVDQYGVDQYRADQYRADRYRAVKHY